MVPQSEFRALAGFDPLWLALIAFMAVNLYFLGIVRRQPECRLLGCGFGGLRLHDAALFVDENHFYVFFVYAAPLLALGDRMHVRFFWGLSASYALNLYLFDGFGQGIPAFHQAVRNLAGLDLTILVALVHGMTFFALAKARRWWFDLRT